MPDVNVFLHDGFPRVWPPVVVIDATETRITFHNCTAKKMRVSLNLPLASGNKQFDVGSRGNDEVLVNVGKAAKGESDYDVYCDESSERARGLSHPIIIIR